MVANPLLKPCPFCGGKAKVQNRANMPEMYQVVCSCRASSAARLMKDDAVFEWNKRVYITMEQGDG